MKVGLFLELLLLTTSLASALELTDDSTISGVNIIPVVVTFNNATASVNNSQFLQGLTPAQVAALYVETDPFAIHKSGDTPWEGDDNHSGYNITDVARLVISSPGSDDFSVYHEFGYPGFFGAYGDFLLGISSDPTTYMNYYQGENIWLGWESNPQETIAYGNLTATEKLTVGDGNEQEIDLVFDGSSGDGTITYEAIPNIFNLKGSELQITGAGGKLLVAADATFQSDLNLAGTLDLGTNTIADGVMVGDWDMMGGDLNNLDVISGAAGLFSFSDTTGAGSVSGTLDVGSLAQNTATFHGDIIAMKDINVTGNVTADYVFGNASFMTGIVGNANIEDTYWNFTKLLNGTLVQNSTLNTRLGDYIKNNTDGGYVIKAIEVNASTGYFSWLGNLANKITTIFAVTIHADVLNSTGTIYSNQTCYTQDCSARIYHNGTGIIITS